MDFDFDTNLDTTNTVTEVNTIPEIENTKKDEEMDKFYNIPSAPIVEDKEEVIPIPTNTVDPGFMNVDKIEKEASTINVERPIANIDELLKSPISDTNPVPTLEETKEEVTLEEPQFRKGRFFTLLDDEEEDTKPTFEPVQKFEPINTQENKPSLLEQLNSGVNNIENKEETQKTEDTFAFFDPMMDLSGLSTPPEIKKEEKSETKVEEPVQNDFDFSIPSFDFNPEITPIEPFPKKEEPVVQISDVEDTSKDFSIETEEENHPISTSRYGADLKTVINTIRNCSETIEKYGYVVDTEEFDFEDMYQVIFKIQKKNK